MIKNTIVNANVHINITVCKIPKIIVSGLHLLPLMKYIKYCCIKNPTNINPAKTIIGIETNNGNEDLYNPVVAPANTKNKILFAL